jgi:hypothetical protein
VSYCLCRTPTGLYYRAKNRLGFKVRVDLEQDLWDSIVAATDEGIRGSDAQRKRERGVHYIAFIKAWDDEIR